MQTRKSESYYGLIILEEHSTRHALLSSLRAGSLLVAEQICNFCFALWTDNLLFLSLLVSDKFFLLVRFGDLLLLLLASTSDTLFD